MFGHLFLWVVGAGLAAFAARHIKEDKEANEGDKDHAAGHGGDHIHQEVLLLLAWSAAGTHVHLQAGLDSSMDSGGVQAFTSRGVLI